MSAVTRNTSAGGGGGGGGNHHQLFSFFSLIVGELFGICKGDCFCVLPRDTAGN